MKALRIYLFVFFAFTPTWLVSMETVKTALKTACRWAIAAGPSWVESYHYSRLLSDNKALALFGDEQLPESEELFIRKSLKKFGYKQWQKVKTRFVKKSMQEYVLTAATSNDKILFINPLYYNELNQQEKQAILAHALAGIVQQHTQRNALILALIPVITHIGLEYFFTLVKLCSKKENDKIPKNLLKLEYYGNSCFVKLAINSVLTAWYFKHSARKQDSVAANLSSPKDLLRYYATMDTKTKKHNQLVSLCQPSTAQRASYLKNIAL